ncbi:hypothetical protein QO034_16650 [Sedimentitalea sp. JM2-8]|uniref:Uncharacterized protein n=1 Tax=Sedimentitalea xiamensis TaxID=3050037 RepID=A0ABT7FHX9_9RHOB|nr:hypothetical protein [Sedimentitalea xiamensis]MDK3074723.1 hypothetical protein [Sedimentitalea xiamensis]
MQFVQGMTSLSGNLFQMAIGQFELFKYAHQKVGLVSVFLAAEVARITETFFALLLISVRKFFLAAVGYFGILHIEPRQFFAQIRDDQSFGGLSGLNHCNTASSTYQVTRKATHSSAKLPNL